MLSHRQQYRILITAVAFAIIGLSFFAGYAGMRSQESPPSNRSNPAQADNSNSPAEKSHIEPSAHKKANEGEKKGPWYQTFLDHAPDWFVAIFTGLLVIVTIRLVQSTNKLWAAGERQIAVAEKGADAARDAADIAVTTLRSTQRAWLKVKVSLSNGPLIFYEDGSASLNFSFVITNVGNAPAINIRPYAWLVPIKGKGGFHWEGQARRSAEVKATPVYGGFALFPNDEFPRSAGFEQWSLGTSMTKEEIEAGVATNTQFHPPEYKKALALYVVGFVDYTFPADPLTHHQTGFILSVGRNAPHPIIPEVGQIPAAELILLEGSGMGIGHFAD